MKYLPFIVLLSGCSIFFGPNEAPKTAKGSHYTISFLAPDWKAKKDKRSDFVFENKKDGRILLSNSFCEEFQEGPLEKLANKTFKTIKEFKSTKSEYTTFYNREAFRLEGSGLVDGVKVGLRILNTRRDNCYFDFLSIDPKNDNSQNDDFKSFLNSVVFK